MTGAVSNGAVLSDCETYRYKLWRWWDTEGRPVVFVGLNPSTADATTDDPTVRRCIGFARDWGYGGMILVNLYALRATDPRELWTHPDPVGLQNNAYLHGAVRLTDTVVAAWGSGIGRRPRARRVVQMLGQHVPWHCLGHTREGHPRHPLYLPKDTKLEAF